eukprot:444231_1
MTLIIKTANYAEDFLIGKVWSEKEISRSAYEHIKKISSPLLPESYKSANVSFARPISTGIQQFHVSTDDRVDKPEMHSAADIQVSDEAMCTGDLPTPIDGLHSAFVISLKVSCLPTHALVLTVAGQMFSWAKGDDGSLGLGSLATRNSLSKILGLEDVRVVQVDTLPRLNSSTEIYWQRRIYIKSPVHKLQKKK